MTIYEYPKQQKQKTSLLDKIIATVFVLFMLFGLPWLLEQIPLHPGHCDTEIKKP